MSHPRKRQQEGSARRASRCYTVTCIIFARTDQPVGNTAGTRPAARNLASAGVYPRCARSESGRVAGFVKIGKILDSHGRRSYYDEWLNLDPQVEAPPR